MPNVRDKHVAPAPVSEFVDADARDVDDEASVRRDRRRPSPENRFELRVHMYDLLLHTYAAL